MVEHSGNGADGTPRPAGTTTTPPQPEDGLNMRERLDRFGDLLGKGLDLAEAGLSLGLTVASTLGAAAQQKIFERMMDAASGVAADIYSPQAGSPEAGPVPPPAAATNTAAEPPPFGITNRLRLTPGMNVSISFSINNDSGTAPKQVSVRVEPFTGQRTGAMLPPASLSVTPDSATIAPMDFEKFVLIGTIPATSPPDVYHGSIAMGAEDGMRIPAVLVIKS